jgi:hypothetical protein
MSRDAIGCRSDEVLDCREAMNLILEFNGQEIVMENVPRWRPHVTIDRTFNDMVRFGHEEKGRAGSQGNDTWCPSDGE